MALPLLIVANGDILDTNWLKTSLSKSNSTLVGVDGGANHILNEGLIPDIVIGDLDSLDSQNIKILEDNWVNIFRFEKEKDETDLELALLYFAENQLWDECDLEIYGALGGRFDHEIANLMLLTHPKLIGRNICLKTPHQTSYVVSQKIDLAGRSGDKVSLIPLGGDAVIANTENLKWPLIQSTLKFGPARGVSNEMTASICSIGIESGILLCVHTERGWER